MLQFRLINFCQQILHFYSALQFTRNGYAGGIIKYSIIWPYKIVYGCVYWDDIYKHKYTKKVHDFVEFILLIQKSTYIVVHMYVCLFSLWFYVSLCVQSYWLFATCCMIIIFAKNVLAFYSLALLVISSFFNNFFFLCNCFITIYIRIFNAILYVFTNLLTI